MNRFFIQIQYSTTLENRKRKMIVEGKDDKTKKEPMDACSVDAPAYIGSFES